MYTQREFKKDLYEICSSCYVKYNLLEDYICRRVSHDSFTKQLSKNKSSKEIEEIINKLKKILHKIQVNGRKLDKDPIDKAYGLRKSGNIEDAYRTIHAYLLTNKENEDAAICFGWIMYDFLKKRETDVDNYRRNLEIFNKNAKIDFSKNTLIHFGSQNNPLETLKTSFLWSILRVIKNDEQNANKIFSAFNEFCRNSVQIIEKRYVFSNELSPSRLIIKEIRSRLNDKNYFEFMDTIGFKWFDDLDYRESSFKNDTGETIKVRSLAEDILNFHVKKLISSDEDVDIRINNFLHILQTLRLVKDSTFFEQLPYYRIKLLVKAKQNENALEELIIFARNKNKDFWVWDLLSELVSENEKFNCLCAGLLCKSKEEMLVKLQVKIIPFLIEKRLFSNAKFELDTLISVRNKNDWKIPNELNEWKNESWYINSNETDSRDSLKIYAKKAEKILYQSLPYTDIFVAYINNEKRVVNFLYFTNSRMSNISEGYFYIDSIDNEIDLKVNAPYKIKMFEDRKRKNLFKVYEVKDGDGKFIKHFIKESIGYVDRQHGNSFAFVDDTYIPAKLVEQYNIHDGAEIRYEKRIRYNKKKNSWSWSVEKIHSITCVS